MAGYTKREQEVAEGFAAGKNTRQIAGDLGISCRTVYTHRRHLAQKLDVAIKDLNRTLITKKAEAK